MWEQWTFLQDRKRLPSLPTIYIGCMTGTSVDCQADFTAAVFDASGGLVAYRNHAVVMPSALRTQLLALSRAISSGITVDKRAVAEASITCFLLTAYQEVIRLFALSGYDSQHIVLSPHGQTICHNPNAAMPYTDILINGEYLARRIGYRVVTRHRQAALAVSLAAPLVPVLIRRLLYSKHQTTWVLNGGGLANICVVWSDANADMIAYDTGPANGPLDAIVQHVLECAPDDIPTDLFSEIAAHQFDVNGAWASRGEVIPKLFDQLMSHAYFALPQNKKSADRADFDVDWVLGYKHPAYSWADVLATVVEVVVKTVVDSLGDCLATRACAKTDKHRFIVYGGVLHHAYLMQRLKARIAALPNFTWVDMRALHYHPDFFESLLLAYLGYCADNRVPIDVSYCKRADACQDKVLAIPGSVAFP